MIDTKNTNEYSFVLPCNQIEYLAIAINTPLDPELGPQRVFHQVESRTLWFGSIVSIILKFAYILG